MRPRIDFQRADIRNYEEIAPLIRGAAVVFHEAAIPSVPRSIDDPVPSHEVNIDGTFQRAARGAGGQGRTRGLCRLVSSAYGDTAGAAQSGEHACRGRNRPTRCRSWWANITANIFSGVYGLETVSLRYFNVYGPRQDPVQRLFRRALALHEGGSGAQGAHHFRRRRAVARLHFCGGRGRAQPESGARAGRVAAACTTPATAAGSRSTRPGRCCRRLEGVDIPPIYGPPRAGDVRDSQADTTLAVRDLGHAPRYTFEEGMRITLEWYRKNR